MKKIFKIVAMMFAALVAVGMTSCDKENPFEPNPGGDAEGQVSFKKMMVEVQNEENIVNAPAATRAAVDVNSFIVTVTDTRTLTAAWTGTYGEMPEVMTLPVGSYEVKVNSAYNPDADWESPYFEGSQSFAITDGAITVVDPVVCKLANVKVTVIFDPKLKAKMGDDCKVTVVACERGRLEYGKEETRSGYFKYIAVEGNQPTLIATFSGTVDENQEDNFRTYTELKPGNHYKITYTLKGVEPDVPDQTGTVNPGVYVDATVTNVDMTIDVDPGEDILPDDGRPGEDSDDPVNPPVIPDDPDAPAPTISANEGIQLGTYPDGIVPNVYTSGMQVEISVHSEATGGITGFEVDIISDTLTPSELEAVGLTDHLDLVNPGQFAESLSGLGFPVNVGGQNDPSVMKLTDFMPLLSVLGPGTSNFVLKVTDANGTTTKTLTIVIN